MSFNTAAHEWGSHAEQLAWWAWNHLVNRKDVFGHYREPGQDPFVDKQGFTHDILMNHFRGEQVADLVGLHTTSADNTSRWLAIDIDQHRESADAEAARNEAAVTQLYAELARAECQVLLSQSDGRGGFHFLIPFNKPEPTDRVFRYGQYLAKRLVELGVRLPEVFPKQPRLREGGFGNWLRLPGRHHTRDHWSRLWNGSVWLKDSAATDWILHTPVNTLDSLSTPPEQVTLQTKRVPSLSSVSLPDEQQIQTYLEDSPQLKEGEGRNNQAFLFGCRLLQEFGLSKEPIAGWLRVLNDRHEEPMDEDELNRIIGNVMKYNNSDQSGQPDEPQHPVEITSLANRTSIIQQRLAGTHGRSHIGLCSKSLPSIDDALLGLRGLSVLAAEPGIGKTTLGLQLGLDILAVHEEACFVFFTFEMSREEIERRMLSRTSGLSWRTLVLGDPSATLDPTDGLMLTADQRKQYAEGWRRLDACKDRVFVVEQNVGAGLDKNWFHECVRQAKDQSGCSRAFVLVDNLQSMPIANPTGGSWDSLSFDRFAIGLLLELQHECPDDDAIMVISEQGKDSMGTAKLRSALGSARIVYSADCVFFLVSGEDDPDEASHPVDFVIRKARDGMKRTTIHLDFDHTCSTFREDPDRKSDLFSDEPKEHQSLNTRSPESRAGVKWTGVELELLCVLHSNGCDPAQIADILKRKKTAVATKLKKLNLN